MSDYMGIPGHLKPTTKFDKIMSDRHKKHRKFVGKLRENTLKKKEKKLEVSTEYNDEHEMDHHKAGMKSRKMLRKLRETLKGE